MFSETASGILRMPGGSPLLGCESGDLIVRKRAYSQDLVGAVRVVGLLALRFAASAAILA